MGLQWWRRAISHDIFFQFAPISGEHPNSQEEVLLARELSTVTTLHLDRRIPKYKRCPLIIDYVIAILVTHWIQWMWIQWVWLTAHLLSSNWCSWIIGMRLAKYCCTVQGAESCRHCPKVQSGLLGWDEPKVDCSSRSIQGYGGPKGQNWCTLLLVCLRMVSARFCQLVNYFCCRCMCWSCWWGEGRVVMGKNGFC